MDRVRTEPQLSYPTILGNFLYFIVFKVGVQAVMSIGLPSLQKMVEALQENDSVEFLAIQTVFKGKTQNTFEKLIETQKQYNLKNTIWSRRR